MTVMGTRPTAMRKTTPAARKRVAGHSKHPAAAIDFTTLEQAHEYLQRIAQHHWEGHVNLYHAADRIHAGIVRNAASFMSREGQSGRSLARRQRRAIRHAADLLLDSNRALVAADRYLGQFAHPQIARSGFNPMAGHRP